MIRAAVLSALCLLCLGGQLRAALEPELTSRYQLRVVLHVAEHRMLTELFQKQIETELRDQLQLALGKMAQVEVVRFHPLLNDIRTKGLQPVLDTMDELSNVETHFVLIDFVNGQYIIQTGHHDGITGLSSASIRRQALADRQRVPDTAAQLVRNDFGVVGSFQSLDGNTVKLAIKAGGLVESLGPWVQRGDVFSVVRVLDEAGKTRARPIEWAILQVVDVLPDGYVQCHYFCRYQEDRKLSDAAPILGYRCLQLKTVPGPVRVRLVNDKTNEFLSGLKVMVSSNDEFRGDAPQGNVFNGLFEAPESFDKVAFVRVLSGAKVLVQFPVPLVDDRTVVCRLSPSPTAMKQGEFEMRMARWLRWYLETIALADQRLGEFTAALTPATLEEALKLGRHHLDAMATELARLSEERANLEQFAGTNKLRRNLSAGTAYEAALTKRQEQLAKYLDDLDKRIKLANSDETRELVATIKRAELLEKQAEFEKAIELYESVLKVRASAEVTTRLAQLKAAWAIKSKEHGQARQFVYATWPTLDLLAVKANLAKAKESFQTLKQAGDHLTPLKLQLVNLQHARALAKELEVVGKAADSEDNRAKLRSLPELGDRLRAFQAEIAAWVKEKS